MRDVVHFAISSHGFGHVSRTGMVVREFARQHPDIEIVATTTVDPRLFVGFTGGSAKQRATSYEPGAVQRSCFEVDLDRTRIGYREWLRERPGRLRAEREFLVERRVRAVVGDIPALALRAAADVGLPSIAFGSFTWDWILAPLFEGSDEAGVPEVLAEDYRSADRYLRLPLSAEEHPFAIVEDVPLVGRLATLEPAELRRRLGIDPDPRPLVLVCPGGWAADDWPPIHVEDEGFIWVLVGDLPVTTRGPALRLPHVLPAGVEFQDIVGAADAVVTKPGYGIASECIVNRTPLVAIERREFRETPVLTRGLAAAGPSAEMALDDFFAGRWSAGVREALASPTPWAPLVGTASERSHGAVDVARRIGEILGLAARETEPAHRAPAEP